MAIGDDASAAGYDLVAGTEDRRDGWTQINKTRDYIAQLKTWATSQLAGKAASSHTHDDRYYTEAEVTASLGGKANAYGSTSAVQYAEGPTSASYNRSATGSSWYAVWMNSALQFMRNTSSRRYKEAIEDASLDVAQILQLKPRTYHRKGQPEGTRELGLIAEECAALGIPHLVAWEEHKPGKWRPEAVRYETVLPVMLLAVVKDQQRRIEALEKKLQER